MLLALICISNWNQEVVKAVKTVWSSVNNDLEFGRILSFSILALKPHLLLMLWLGSPSANASVRAGFLLCWHFLKKVNTQKFKSGVHFLRSISSWGEHGQWLDTLGVFLSVTYTRQATSWSHAVQGLNKRWMLWITREIHPRDTRRGF